MEQLERELDQRGLGVDNEIVEYKLKAAENQPSVNTDELEEARELIIQLQRERDVAHGEEEKLQEELAILKTRMWQLEESYSSRGGGGTMRTDRALLVVLRADAPAFAPTTGAGADPAFEEGGVS